MSIADAPFVYFDGVAAAHTSEDGMTLLTLVAARVMPQPNGPAKDVVAVAHLRCGPNALANLREALARLEGRSGVKLVAN